VNLFASPSPLTISETNTTASVNNTSNFGFLDAPVLDTAVGIESALPDAVITVVSAPEPTALGLLAVSLVSLGFNRRRRA
jgi:hypothetical protein